jgi:hypothetical protein
MPATGCPPELFGGDNTRRWDEISHGEKLNCERGVMPLPVNPIEDGAEPR